jgi:hypothetical protein
LQYRVTVMGLSDLFIDVETLPDNGLLLIIKTFLNLIIFQ